MNDPLISMNFLGGKRVFQPAEPLEFEYQIDAVQDEQLAAVEASLLWYTDGKGDEDSAFTMLFGAMAAPMMLVLLMLSVCG